MEPEITVRIVQDKKGRFIGRAVGFRGVIASGSNENEVLDRVIQSWVAIYRAKQSKAPFKPTPGHQHHAQERSFKLQPQFA